MTLLSVRVFDPLWKSDDKIIPKDKDCIEFWKKTLQFGQESELYEIFQQTVQDVLFRAQIQTVSDIGVSIRVQDTYCRMMKNIVAFVRFLCYIGTISVELIDEPEPEPDPKSKVEPKVVEDEESQTSNVEMSTNEEDKVTDKKEQDYDEPNIASDNVSSDGDEGTQPEEDSLEPDEDEDEHVSSNQDNEKEVNTFPCQECDEKFPTPWDYDIHFYTKHAPQPTPLGEPVTAKRGRRKRKLRKSPRKTKKEGLVADVDKVTDSKSKHKFRSKRLCAKYGSFDEVLNRDRPEEIRDISTVLKDVKNKVTTEVPLATAQGLESEPDDNQNDNQETNDSQNNNKETNDDTEDSAADGGGSTADGSGSAADGGGSAADGRGIVTEPETTQPTELQVSDDSVQKKKGRPRGSSGGRMNHRSYPCRICSEQVYGHDFKSHMQNVHQLNSEVKCLTCNRIFYSQDMLLEHVERHRAHNLKKYTCSICGKNLKNIYTLEYHEKSHSKPEQCSLCPKSFTTPGTLKRHMVVHTQETRFKCKYCPKEFYHANKCMKHEASHQEKTLKCSKCDLAFHFKSGLHIHMQTHDPDRELVPCDLCSKSFKTKGNLTSHIRQVHQKQKMHACTVCGIKFAKTSTRKRHEATHTDVKPYQCEICGKNFREKGHLKRHVEWHKGEQKNQCDVCGRLFSFKDNMLKHRRIHTGETPYSCDLCNQSFSYIEQLKKHKKKLHTVVMAEDVQYETTLEIPSTKQDQVPSSNILSDAIQACLSLDIESTIEVM